MSTVQIWNGSTWIDFYTLPNATSSTLGGVKIGNNITVNSGTISLTKDNVTSALGYTPLPLSGGNMSGHIYLTGSNASSSTGNTSQVVFGTANNQHIVLSANDKALIINPTTSNTANQIVLYLNQQSVFPSGITSNGTINASTLQENGTALSSKYLGINDKAANSNKLNGQLASYYALASHTHTSLKSNTDNRSTNTTPNNYNSVFNIAGLKTNSAIGLGTSTYGDYSCVMGVRGWSDSSGGHAHEIALTGNGYLMHRSGATTSWNDWKRIAYTSDIPDIATQSAAGLMSSTDKTKLDGIATGATKVTTDTVSGWGYTKNTGTVTQVKVGTTAYNPSSGVVSLPAYPSIPTSLKNPNSITIKAGTDTVSSYDGSAAKTFTLAASTTAGAFTVSDGTTTKTIQLAGQFTDNNSWRPVVDNLTSTATDQSLSANQGKVLKGLVDGKAASNHTHSSVLDIGNSTATTFAYSKSGLGYDNYTWLAGWNGYELRAVNKSHFATADHTHSQYLTSQKYRPIQVNGATLLANTIDTALNLKAGTNITLLSNRSTGVITINSTASGGMTCAQVFEGAGDTSGQYHQAGSWSTKINIVSQGYKLLVFYVNVADCEFPFCAYVPSSSFSYTIYCACANQNGNLTVIEIVYSDSSFTASQVSGGPLYNVNIYAYK